MPAQRHHRVVIALAVAAVPHLLGVGAGRTHVPDKCLPGQQAEPQRHRDQRDPVARLVTAVERPDPVAVADLPFTQRRVDSDRRIGADPRPERVQPGPVPGQRAPRWRVEQRPRSGGDRDARCPSGQGNHVGLDPDERDPDRGGQGRPDRPRPLVPSLAAGEPGPGILRHVDSVRGLPQRGTERRIGEVSGHASSSSSRAGDCAAGGAKSLRSRANPRDAWLFTAPDGAAENLCGVRLAEVLEVTQHQHRLRPGR